MSFPTKAQNINTLDYLVLDSLFLLRQEELLSEKYTSFNSFLKALFTGADTKSISRHIKIFYETTGSFFPQNFGIEKLTGKAKSNYVIPEFLDRLLLWTIDTVLLNPYMDEKGSLNTDVETFFCENYPAIIDYYSSGEDLKELRKKAKSSEDAMLDRLLSYYALDRLYDAESMIRIIKARDDLPTKIDNLADIILSLYFIPNTLEKRKYVDMLLQGVQSDRILSTQFDWWQHEEGSIGTFASRTTKAETAAINLTRFGEYFRYLAKVYYPVLTASFYTMFRSCYPALEDGKRLLLDYVNTHELLSNYEKQVTEQSKAFCDFRPRDWKQVAVYCSMIADGVWKNEATARRWKNETTIRYVEADGTYLNTLTQAVIREKVEYKRKKSPVFLSEEQMCDMMTALKDLYTRNSKSQDE